jgi:hypothetical protein
MEPSEIDGLRHWSFIGLFQRNIAYYKNIYSHVEHVIARNIPSYPSYEDMQDGMFAVLLEDQKFKDHYLSKNSHNLTWHIHCARLLAKFIVSEFYKIS